MLRILEQQHDFKINRRHLGAFIRQYKSTGLLSAPRKERLSKLSSPEILDFIDQKMQSNDETTSTDLVKMMLEELNVTLSETTVKRVRIKLGWLSTGTKYCQLVKTFDNVIFTDESSIAMESHARLSFHRWWEPPRLKGTKN
jgi:hypothetical protein